MSNGAAKPKCPECDVELVLVDGKLPEKCEKCGFNIAAYQPLKRMLSAFAKESKSTTPEKKEAGMLDWLMKL